MHPLVVQMAKAVLEGFAPVETTILLAPLARIIPCVKRVNVMSAEVVIEYNEGITGSQFTVGGIDQIIIPLQVSSDIAELLRLSTAAFWERSNLMWSCMSVPSVYLV